MEMSNRSVNEVGPDGYDIFTWRGSYNCRHRWVQLMYQPVGRIVNNDKVDTGVEDEDNMPGPDTRTTATIAAGNTPPRVGFSSSNPDVSALSPYVEQISKPVKKPVLASLPLFEKQEDAEAIAMLIGCEGSHEHSYGDKKLFMPCKAHPKDQTSYITDDDTDPDDVGGSDNPMDNYGLEDACWEGYIAIGLKDDGSPNCVPEKMAIEMMKEEFQSYDDYPSSVRGNACKAIKWKEEHGDEVKGMTQVGWIRANQLCKGEKISEETIARMSGFQRHKKNSEVAPEYKDTPWKDKGYVAWLGWGGPTGIEWASNKLESIRNNMSKQYFQADDEKRIVLGPAMIPDQKIFRKDNMGNPYYVFFSPETIKMIAEKYMRNKYTDNNDQMHDGKAVKDVYVVESWIKEDENDKSVKYGYGDLPVGTWFVSMKVKNDDTWSKVKSGVLNGFSVSGFFEEVSAFTKEEMFLYKVAEVLKKYKD
jgi:hypothetical protein